MIDLIHSASHQLWQRVLLVCGLVVIGKAKDIYFADTTLKRYYFFR